MYKFTIIGCGAMGSWFAMRLAERGAELALLDKDQGRATSLAQRVGGKIIKSLGQIAYDQPVLLALPVEAARGVLHTLVTRTRGGLRIVEITSFKGPLRGEIKLARRKGHVVASIHPLFGPGQRGDEGTVTVHVERATEDEDRLIKALLPGTRVVYMDLREHDDAMLVALSLTHFVGLSAAHILASKRRVKDQTPSLRTLLALISITLSEPDSFYEGHAMTSREAIALFKKYRDSVDEVIKVLERRRPRRFVYTIRRRVSNSYDLRGIYSSLYSLCLSG